MWKRKRIRILFTSGDFKFVGTCSASVNINSDYELLEDYCEDIEDLEDVEFIEAIDPKLEYTEDDISNELDISDYDIEDVLTVLTVIN